ncbi:MAG: nitroreductase, partial [Muribaculaceae bacterium]|nr:nitroreductase [Muribaculaceae bacterium]
MNIKTIESRHSVRAYTDRAIPVEIIEALDCLVAEINRTAGLCVRLVTNEPEVFGKSIMARYGKFSGVRNYFVLAGPRSTDCERQLGYHGERLVLKAQELGLNTCWVGLSYSRRRIDAGLPAGARIYAAIALGYGATQGVPHKSKTPLQIDPQVDSAPEWYRRGIDCALLAPTALNQQKFRFAYL